MVRSPSEGEGDETTRQDRNDMKSDDHAQQADEKEDKPCDSYYCPICITTYELSTKATSKNSATAPDGCRDETGEEELESETEDGEEEVEEFDVTGMEGHYELKSCGHVMCKRCLSLYCASKVRDGAIDIKCCYPTAEKDPSVRNNATHMVKCCDTSLHEEDIRHLLLLHDFYSSVDKDSRSKDVVLDTLCRYERFKFDSIHGDSVRRCPKCDHPKIFDMIPKTVQPEENSARSRELIKNAKKRKFPWSVTRRKDRNLQDDSKFTSDVDQNEMTDTDRSKSQRILENEITFEDIETGNANGKLFASASMSSSDDDRNYLKEILEAEDSKSDDENGPGHRQEEQIDVMEENASRIEDKPERNNSSILKNGRHASFTTITSIADTSDAREENPKTNIYDNDKQPKQPTTNCTECGTEFCYYHSNAHAGRSCNEYEDEMISVNIMNEEYLRSNVKSCPRCSISVQKSGGCNQMQCPKCGVHFCWLCLTEVDGGTFPAHFQWWNLAGCPNMQLNERVNPPRSVLIWTKLMAIAQVIVIGIPSVILAIASSIVCCCCVPSMGDNTRERATHCVSFWGNCLTVTLAFPLILAGGIISSFFCIVAACCVILKRMFLRVGGGSSDDETVKEVDSSVPEGNTAGDDSVFPIRDEQSLRSQFDVVLGLMEEGQ